MREELIAPCGMNCAICIAFFGYTMSGKTRKMKCIGCNPSGKSCAHLKKYCKKLSTKEIEYCYECNDFPCKQMQKLDTKYRERFDMSTIDNLEYIKENGMKKFLQEQEEKYKCPNVEEYFAFILVGVIIVIVYYRKKYVNIELLDLWNEK